MPGSRKNIDSCAPRMVAPPSFDPPHSNRCRRNIGERVCKDIQPTRLKRICQSAVFGLLRGRAVIGARNPFLQGEARRLKSLLRTRRCQDALVLERGIEVCISNVGHEGALTSLSMRRSAATCSRIEANARSAAGRRATNPAIKAMTAGKAGAMPKAHCASVERPGVMAHNINATPVSTAEIPTQHSAKALKRIRIVHPRWTWWAALLISEA